MCFRGISPVFSLLFGHERTRALLSCVISGSALLALFVLWNYELAGEKVRLLTSEIQPIFIKFRIFEGKKNLRVLYVRKCETRRMNDVL